VGASGLTSASVLGWGDEMRVGLRGTSRRVWGRRGVKVRQRLQLQYEWRYLFLVVDGRAGRLWWLWLESMKATELRAAVGGLRQQTPVEAIVWDRAPSHRDAGVRALGPALIEQPPYAPELNPAERVFEELRRGIEGRLYPTLEAKVAAVEAILAELDADPVRVQRLAGWAWIREACAALAEPIAA
jgi:transposase